MPCSGRRPARRSPAGLSTEDRGRLQRGPGGRERTTLLPSGGLWDVPGEAEMVKTGPGGRGWGKWERRALLNPGPGRGEGRLGRRRYWPGSGSHKGRGPGRRRGARGGGCGDGAHTKAAGGAPALTGRTGAVHARGPAAGSRAALRAVIRARSAWMAFRARVRAPGGSPLGTRARSYSLWPAGAGARAPACCSAPRGCAPARDPTRRGEGGAFGCPPPAGAAGRGTHAHLSSGARGHLQASPGAAQARCSPLVPPPGHCWPLRILGMPHWTAGRRGLLYPAEMGLTILVCPPFGKAADFHQDSISPGRHPKLQAYPFQACP